MFVKLAGRKERVKCQFVGLSENEWLVVKLPSDPKVRAQIREGDVLNLRCLSRGNILGFDSQVLGFMDSPYGLMFLKFPVKTVSHALRGSRRLDCSFPAALLVGNRERKGVIVDMSLGGCRFFLDRASDIDPADVPEGAVFQGRFLLLDDSLDFRFEAEVVSRVFDGERRVLGLKFDRERGGMPEGLRDYILEIDSLLGG
ncbi:MAG: flagellar brake protein [Desulfovibrionaceae bacterium]|nr:flagellar brake protein [Desulfovibrionaceae bacterium]